jgi:hypothetical protein
MGATQADLSLEVGPEVARLALRSRLAGEARHLHKKSTWARGAESANPTLGNHPADALPERPHCILSGKLSSFRNQQMWDPIHAQQPFLRPNSEKVTN